MIRIKNPTKRLLELLKDWDTKTTEEKLEILKQIIEKLLGK